jgi:hypothetical protein
MATEYFIVLYAHNGNITGFELKVQDWLTSATCFGNKLPKESSAVKHSCTSSPFLNLLADI